MLQITWNKEYYKVKVHILVSLDSSNAIFILRSSWINMCYLSTLAQKILIRKIRIITKIRTSLENLAENFWFSVPTFKDSFEKFKIDSCSSDNHVKI